MSSSTADIGPLADWYYFDFGRLEITSCLCLWGLRGPVPRSCHWSSSCRRKEAEVRRTSAGCSHRCSGWQVAGLSKWAQLRPYLWSWCFVSWPRHEATKSPTFPSRAQHLSLGPRASVHSTHHPQHPYLAFKNVPLSLVFLERPLVWGSVGLTQEGV